MRISSQRSRKDQPVRSVPFTIPSLFGLGQCHGIVYDEGDHFRFEYQVKDSISGMIKSAVKQVKIPVQEINSVQLIKGWLGSTWMGVKVVLQANSFETFKDIPGMTHGKIELEVTKANAAQAEEFVNGLYCNE